MAIRPTSGMGYLRASDNAVLLVAPGREDDKLDPETEVWISRARQAGGTFLYNSVSIADRLIKAIKASSFNSRIKYLLPFLGGNLATAIVPLRDTFGVGIATNNNFANSDFSQSTGLQGNGSTKYLESGIVPAVLGGLTNNGGLGWWENNYNSAGNVEPIGTYTVVAGPIEQRFVIDLRTTVRAFRWGDPGNGAQDGGAASNGHFYGQRSSPTRRTVFFQGSLLASNSTPDTAANSSQHQIIVCGVASRSGLSYVIQPWQGRAACAYMTDGGMTNGEISAFHSLLSSKLISATGRPS